MEVHAGLLLVFFVYAWCWSDQFFLIKTPFNDFVNVILEVLSPPAWGLSWNSPSQLLEALPSSFFGLNHHFIALRICGLWAHNKSACINPWCLCENEKARGGKNALGNGSSWGFRFILHIHEQLFHHIVFLKQLPLCFANFPMPWSSLLPSIFSLVSLELGLVSNI